MIRNRAAIQSSPLIRIMRSSAMRWVLAMVLVPLLSVGAFGGGRLLVHGCDDHGVHIHPVGAGGMTVSQHAAMHMHDHPQAPGSTDGAPHGQDTEGVLVSMPRHQQIPARSVELTKALSPPVLFVVAVLAIPTGADLQERAAPLASPPMCGPLDLVVLGSSARLVRTSHALLL